MCQSTEVINNYTSGGAGGITQRKMGRSSSVARNDDHGIRGLLLCTFGICSCYLYFGVLQEQLFTGKNRMGATFTLVTGCITNAIVALAWQHLQNHLQTSFHRSPKQDSRPLHHSLFLLTSLCYVAAMTCSNESIQYVSYPVAVLAKSCKLIPTMIVGQLVERSSYSSQEWLAALFISFGTVLFHFSRIHFSTESSFRNSQFGMALLLASLLMDGLLSSSQNLLKKDDLSRYRSPSAVETMLFINLYALFYLTPLAVLGGQWTDGLHSLAVSLRNESHPLLLNVFILNLVVGIGQIFIFLTIQWYSPLVVTTITTTRKFVTILLSVWTFGHRFSLVQWVAILLVFTGLYLVILVQNRSYTKTKGP